MSRHIAVGLALLLLVACSGKPDDPETRLRQWLSDAEAAVESRSLEQAAELISPDYQGEQVRTRRDLMRLLLGYFHRHQQIHLLTRVAVLSINEAGDNGQLSLFVAMAGVPVESAKGLARINADYHRFDLQLRQEDGEWRLRSATWRRASLNDLLNL